VTRALRGRIAALGVDWIVPDWPVPDHVAALSTTRHGGLSTGPRATLDVGGGRPDDDPQRAAILGNRARIDALLPAPPIWLAQVHGADVARIGVDNVEAARVSPPVADAAVTTLRHVVLAVRTADCLPVLFADRRGTVVGVAHAGWRGLAHDVLEATLAALGVPPADVVAWFGPAIGPQTFEVGRDVLDAFCAQDPGARACFMPRPDGKWLADLCGLARRRLGRAGVGAISGGGWCTYTQSERFFSYRRERDAGRMATLLWLVPR
jgi:YfiH family protein